MTDITTAAPLSPADRMRAWEEALAEAREYLIATADRIHADLSAKTLWRYVLKYRAHLATLAAACGELTADIAEQAPLPATDTTVCSEPAADIADD